jgi:hypothetical protein
LWINYEKGRLSYFYNNRHYFRKEYKYGLMDEMNGFKSGKDIGQAVILPSSHPGSPRNMFELYHDSMAIVGKYGNF